MSLKPPLGTGRRSRPPSPHWDPLWDVASCCPGRQDGAVAGSRSLSCAWKTIIPPEPGELELRTHEGYEWLYVLAGRVPLIFADHDLTLGPGEVAEFDTRLPHWFGPADDQPVEILSPAGPAGGTHPRPRRAPPSRPGPILPGAVRRVSTPSVSGCHDASAETAARCRRRGG